MPEPKLLISAHKACILVRQRTILDSVDIEIHSGEIITLIGPNGAGKSTLVRALLGLQALTSGHIHRHVQLRLGYMPQHIRIDDVLPLTAGRFVGLSHTQNQSAVIAALDEVDAAHLSDVPVQQISGGEMRRILLARALIHNPNLLILDEPTQGVDIVGQSEFYTLITRLRDEHDCGVLIVSHDLRFVMEASDGVVCLNQHVCCEGHPESVSKHPEYLRLFGHTEGEGVAVYTHHHDHLHDRHGGVEPLNERAGQDG